MKLTKSYLKKISKMKFLAILFTIGVSLELSLNTTEDDPNVESLWVPLPEGFDQKKPDEILDHVRAARQDDDKLPFSHFYLFGDSSCDTHNLFELNRGKDPSPIHYWKGRVSNGPMWPDYFEARYDIKLKNYAFSGSTILASNYAVGGSKINIPDFPKQVDKYYATMFNTSNPLAIIQFVGNDLLNTNITAEKVTSDMETQLQRLIDIGEIHHIIVIESTSKAHIDRGYNIALTSMVDRFQSDHPDINIFSYSIIDRFNKMHTIPPPTTDPGKWYADDIPCYNQKTGSKCFDPQNYFLYDLYHPTTVPNHNSAAHIGKLIQSLNWN